MSRWMPVAAACLIAGPPAAVPAPDEEALALFERVAEAYRGLDHYADGGERSRALVIDGARIEDVEPFRLAFARPDRLAVTTPSARLVADGDALQTVVPPAGYFERAERSGPVGVDVLAVTAVGSKVEGDPLGPPLPLILGLLTGEEPGRSVRPSGADLTLEPDRRWRDRDVHCLRVAGIARPDWRLFIDPESLLILGGEAALDDDDRAAIAPPGATIDAFDVSWSAGAIATEPAGPGTFAIEPPPGLAEVGRLLDPEGRDEGPGRDDDRLGRPAPEFSVRLLDGDAPGEALRKLDLEGRVVLIDFWATWCGPCLKELPEVADLLDRLEADATEGLSVLCVSIDQDAGDLDEHAESIARFLRERDLELRRPPLAEVGLDPRGAMARAFGVDGIPAAFLLDRDGVIRHVFEGYDPQIRQRLGDRIDDLLDAPDPGR